MDLKELVKDFMICGRNYGFAIAEAILDKYTPDNIIEGKCYQVPPKKRIACSMAFKAGPSALTKEK